MKMKPFDLAMMHLCFVDSDWKSFIRQAELMEGCS